MSRYPGSGSSFFGQPAAQPAQNYPAMAGQQQRQYQGQHGQPSNENYSGISGNVSDLSLFPNRPVAGNPRFNSQMEHTFAADNWNKGPAHAVAPVFQNLGGQSPSTARFSAAQAAGRSGSSFSPVQPIPERRTIISSVIADEMEEGELSESQDEYDPRASFIQHQDLGRSHPLQPSTIQPKPFNRRRPTASRSSRATSIVEGQGTDFYEEEEEGEVLDTSTSDSMHSTQTRPDAGRERSGSYSPYLSAAEVQDANTPDQNAQNSDAPMKGAQVRIPTSPANQRRAITASASATAVAEVQGRQSDDLRNLAQNTNEANATPLSKAKEEAARAVLELLSLGVNYQSYIDEGFDRKLINSIFTDLRLSVPEPTPVAPSPATQPRQAPAPANKPASLQPTPSSIESTLPKAGVRKEQMLQPHQLAKSKSSQSEERKDRIARLLAAKKAPGPRDSASPAQAPAAEDTPPTMPAPTKRRKDMLLQEKMAALQKARLASSALPAPTLDLVDRSIDPTDLSLTKENLGPADLRSIESAAVSATEQSLLPEPQQSPFVHEVRKLQPSRTATAPPQLFLPSVTPDTQAVHQRKRPVAADFVEYSSVVGKVKRPFGQDRGETSLVIDVSDASDADEADAEMDVDAPNGTSLAYRPNGDGRSIRDFPPLSDVKKVRQISSPLPPAPGFASRPPATRAQASEYEMKQKAIEDLKRQIALKEAERGSKKASPQSSTPANQPESRPLQPETLQMAQTSTSASPQSSSGLLSGSSAIRAPARRSEKVLRERLVSLKITQADAVMQQKRAEFERLQNEMATLEADTARWKLELAELGDQMQTDAATEDSGIATTSSEEPGPGASLGSPARILDANEDAEVQGLAMQPSAQDMDMDRGEAHSAVAPNADALNDRPALKSQSPVNGVTNELNPAMTTAKDASESEPPPDRARDASEKADNTTKLVAGSAGQPADQFEEAAHGQEVEGVVTQISAAAQADTATQDLETAIPGQVPPRSPSQESSAPDHTPFSRYVSPLHYFHAFRYHPQYRETVPGGLKSVTYSNHIDPKRALCPDELDGRICPRGAACEFQHFKAMTVPGDQLIAELGNTAGLSENARNKFLAGMRQLLAKFRTDKVKDFGTIAQAIIDLRSSVLGDSFKVLPLDGVTV